MQATRLLPQQHSHDDRRAIAGMLEGQLLPNRVSDVRILRALEAVPRAAFLPPRYRQVCCIDADLPFSDDTPSRAMPSPLLFARLLLLAELTSRDRVLDVGCGAGYSAHVLSRLAREVVALEADTALATRAMQLLKGSRLKNVALISGPAEDGAPEYAPYDVILVAEGMAHIPNTLAGQLKEGGKLVTVWTENDIGYLTRFVKEQGVLHPFHLCESAPRCLRGFEAARPFLF